MSSLSLRARFQLLVLFGAVLPLAIVGLWLTNASSRAGRTLLRAQLDSTAAVLGSVVNERWATRQGELALLANNDVVSRGVARGQLDASGREYLSQLTQALSPQIDASVYRADGTLWWSMPHVGADSARLPASVDMRSVPWVVPVVDSSGRHVGDVRAHVRLSSLLNAIEARPVVPGARVTMLTPGELAPEARAGDEQSETRALGGGVRLVLSAPSDPYVRPFALAARVGLGVLVTVALIALLLSGFVATRLTRSLERLAAAADAVAAGDLSREIDSSGAPEVMRVASAFNAMTRSLQSTLAELSQQKALVAVGEFAASLSHEVRNALTAIRVDLQHAARQLPSDNRASPLVQRSLGTVRRLDSTVTGALRVARGGHANPAPVSLRAILNRALHQAGPAFADPGGTLGELPAGEDVLVRGDPAALEQLFLNLLINAGQALLPGGSAFVAIDTSPGEVIVRICDTGIGMAHEELALVGQPLRTTKPEGTGLGLPIARRIAEAHRGRIEIESVAGRGTEVRVTLPRQ